MATIKARPNDCVVVPVRLQNENLILTKAIADQCGLTVDQMASALLACALFVVAWPRFVDPIPVKPPAKKASRRK